MQGNVHSEVPCPTERSGGHEAMKKQTCTNEKIPDNIFAVIDLYTVFLQYKTKSACNNGIG